MFCFSSFFHITVTYNDHQRQYPHLFCSLNILIFTPDPVLAQLNDSAFLFLPVQSPVKLPVLNKPIMAEKLYLEFIHWLESRLANQQRWLVLGFAYLQ